jgi:hypothetical protein
MKKLIQDPPPRKSTPHETIFLVDFPCNLDHPLKNLFNHAPSSKSKWESIPINEVFDRLKSQLPKSNQSASHSASSDPHDVFGAIEPLDSAAQNQMNLHKDYIACYFLCLRTDHFIRHCMSPIRCRFYYRYAHK